MNKIIHLPKNNVLTPMEIKMYKNWLIKDILAQMNFEVATFIGTLKVHKAVLRDKLKSLKRRQLAANQALTGRNVSRDQLQEFNHYNKEIEKFSTAVKEINFEIDKLKWPQNHGY